jgi:hypothetical protein
MRPGMFKTNGRRNIVFLDQKARTTGAFLNHGGKVISETGPKIKFCCLQLLGVRLQGLSFFRGKRQLDL